MAIPLVYVSNLPHSLSLVNTLPGSAHISFNLPSTGLFGERVISVPLISTVNSLVRFADTVSYM